jgi:hypothetical protein
MSLREKRFPVRRALVLGSAALYLSLNLFASPRVPFLLSGDQAYFWMDAMRILDGHRVYQDFLQFTPPGTDLLFALMFKLFGLRLWVTNLVVFVLGLSYAWLIYSIARKFMRPASTILATALFLVPIYGKALNATHHWFGVLAVLAAIRVVLGAITSSRVATAGTFLGVASFFSLTHGVAALLAFSVFLAWGGLHARTGWLDFLRRQAPLFGGYILALALLSSPYFVSIGIRRLWYFQVTYVRAFVAHYHQGEPLALLLPLRFTLHNLPGLSEYLVIYLLLSAATVVALYLCWTRRRENVSIQPMILVGLVAIMLFAEVSFTLSWLRLYAVSAPGVILLAWAIERLPKARMGVSTALWVWILFLAAHQTVARHRMERSIVVLPAGNVATTQAMADGLKLVAEFAKPGDAVFQARWPGIYLPLHLHNPLYADTEGIADMPRPSDVGLAIEQLAKQRVPYILWAADLDSSCCRDRISSLREYVHTRYVPVAALPDDNTLWRRRE